MNFSYWERKHLWKNWDILVIGSGITGLTSAIYTKRKFPHAGIAVVEKGALPSGASTKNAGFACIGSVSEILDDLDRQPEKEVFELIEKRYKGLALLRELVGDKNIAYEPVGGYEIFLENELEKYKTCLGSLGYLNAEMVNAIGKQVFWDAQSKISKFGFVGAAEMLENTAEGLIDTGLMMRNLVLLARQEGIEIINGIDVLSLEMGNKPIVQTQLGEIKPGKVLIATNAFARKLMPEIDVNPCRAQVLVTSVIDGLQMAGGFHHDRGYNYFRHIDGRVLLGGGRHVAMDAENTDAFAITDVIQNYLENLLRDVILPGKSFEIEQRWSGIMGMGNSKDVILKKLGPSTFCAVRFGGMGVALGSYIGNEVSRMLASEM